MSIQPEELANNLLGQLGPLVSGDVVANETILNKLKEDATALQKHGDARAFIVLAGVAFLEHKTQDMIEYHKKSLRLSINDLLVNANYAVSLFNTGRFEEASHYSSIASSIAGDSDIEFLTDALKHAVNAGSFEDASVYAQKLTVMNVPSNNNEHIPIAMELMTSLSLSQESIQSYYNATTDVLVKHDVYTQGTHFWASNEEGELQLIREMLVDVSAKKAAEMNIDLSNTVAKIGLPIDLLMAFCCLFTTVKIGHSK